MAKKIFITGAAGFIGFHLAQHLQQRGDLVVGCDNFNSYYSPSLKRERAALLHKKGIEVYDCDICSPSLLHSLVKEQDSSHFVHLAAQAGVRHSIDHPESYLHSNLDGFFHVLELCRSRPQMQLIFASSSSVYGLNQKIPFSETDPTDHPANLYAATKKSAELLAFSYHHLYSISVRALRFFTVYGPWGRPDMAYFSFTRSILEGKPIHLYHNGALERDFTYIDDIVKGTAAAIDYEGAFEIFNLGNHHPKKVTELLDIIEKRLGKKAIIEEKPMQKAEVLSTYADISKAEKLLHFSPSTSLEEGMDHFLSWYLSRCAKA